MFASKNLQRKWLKGIIWGKCGENVGKKGGGGDQNVPKLEIYKNDSLEIA